MKSILGIGVNTLDYTISTNQFPIEDSKNIGYENSNISAGGPIPNALVCLSRLGFSTTYVGNTSQDNQGDFIVNSLKNEGVDVSEVIRTAIEVNKSFIISNNVTNTRTVLWRKIPKSDYFEISQIPYHKIKNSDVILIDGLEKKCTEEIVKYAKQENKEIIYGAESVSQAKSLLPYVDILVAPKNSIKKFIGVENEEDIMNFLMEFSLKKAFITEGENGSYGIDFNKKNIFYQQSFNIDVVDTTGAGDAFLGGIVYSTLNKKNMENSLIIASAVSALNCLSLSGIKGLPNIVQLKQFLKNNNLEGILK